MSQKTGQRPIHKGSKQVSRRRVFRVDWAEIAAFAISLVLLILMVYFRAWMTHPTTLP